MTNSDSESECSTVYLSDGESRRNQREEKEKRLNAAFEARTNYMSRVNVAPKKVFVCVDLSNDVKIRSSLLGGLVYDSSEFMQDYMSNDLLSDVLVSASKHFGVPVKDFEIETCTRLGGKAKPHMTIDRISGIASTNLKLKYNGRLGFFEWKDYYYRLPLGEVKTKDDLLNLGEKRFNLASQGLQLVEVTQDGDKKQVKPVGSMSESAVEELLKKDLVWLVILQTIDLTEALESELASLTIRLK